MIAEGECGNCAYFIVQEKDKKRRNKNKVNHSDPTSLSPLLLSSSVFSHPPFFYPSPSYLPPSLLSPLSLPQAARKRRLEGGAGANKAPIEPFVLTYGQSKLTVGQDELTRLDYNGEGPAETGYFNDRLIDLACNEGITKELGMTADNLAAW